MMNPNGQGEPEGPTREPTQVYPSWPAGPLLPGGAYADVPVWRIPLGYLTWVCEQPEVSESLKEKLEQKLLRPAAHAAAKDGTTVDDTVFCPESGLAGTWWLTPEGIGCLGVDWPSLYGFSTRLCPDLNGPARAWFALADFLEQQECPAATGVRWFATHLPDEGQEWVGVRGHVLLADAARLSSTFQALLAEIYQASSGARDRLFQEVNELIEDNLFQLEVGDPDLTAETNCPVWTLANFEVTSIALGPSCLVVEIKYTAEGEQDPEKCFDGDTILGHCLALIDAEGRVCFGNTEEELEVATEDPGEEDSEDLGTEA